MASWLKMDSAPKTGERIIVLTSDFGIVTAWWDASVTNFYKSQQGWASYDPANAQGDWVSEWAIGGDLADRRLYCGATLNIGSRSAPSRSATTVSRTGSSPCSSPPAAGPPSSRAVRSGGLSRGRRRAGSFPLQGAGRPRHHSRPEESRLGPRPAGVREMKRRRRPGQPKRIALYPEVASGDVVGPGDDIGAWFERALSKPLSGAARCQVRAYRVGVRAYPRLATIMQAA